MEVEAKDVKWTTHEEVVKKINVEAKHLRIAVITPIKPWIKYRRESLRTFAMAKSKVSSNRMSISSVHSSLSSSSSKSDDSFSVTKN